MTLPCRLCCRRRLFLVDTFNWFSSEGTGNINLKTEHDAVSLDRRMFIDPKEHWKMLRSRPEVCENSKILKVAILGSPNAGKSVLTNSLTGANVSAVSKKVHTTQKLTTGVLVSGSIQVVFWDTPGVISSVKAKKHNLQRSLLVDPESSLTRVDIMAILVDVGDMRRTRLDPEILHLLYRYRPMPAVLVLNKIDLGDYYSWFNYVTRR